MCLSAKSRTATIRIENNINTTDMNFRNTMTSISAWIFLLIGILDAGCNDRACADLSTGSFPAKADPVEIGKLLTRRFIADPYSQYGSPLRIHEPRTQVTYPDVCAWLGGLWFAHETGDKELKAGLVAKFEPLFANDSCLLPKPNHVDNNVFGAVPLEIYMQKHDPRCLKLGMMYADSQWTLPEGWSLD